MENHEFPADILEKIQAFCVKQNVSELSLFGSALREDFGPDSDVDLLIRFSPEARPTLFDLVRMKEELGNIIGRDVDLVSKDAIEASRNPYRRQTILASAKVIYAA